MKKETMVAEFEDFQLPEENKQNEKFSRNQKESNMDLTISALRELANQENTGLLRFMVNNNFDHSVFSHLESTGNKSFSNFLKRFLDSDKNATREL